MLTKHFVLNKATGSHGCQFTRFVRHTMYMLFAPAEFTNQQAHALILQKPNMATHTTLPMHLSGYTEQCCGNNTYYATLACSMMHKRNWHSVAGRWACRRLLSAAGKSHPKQPTRQQTYSEQVKKGMRIIRHAHNASSRNNCNSVDLPLLAGYMALMQAAIMRA